MATNSNCEGCGCGPSIPEPCITPPPICPDPQPCVEIVNAECVKYTGPALLCNDVPIIPTNTSLSDALAALVDLTCEDACCTIPAVTSIDDPDYIMLCVDDTAFCPYDGLLYNWFAINAAIAGDGRAVGGIVNVTALDNPINTWRVPNNNDWQALVTAINPSATFTPWNNTVAGPMKSITCWSIPNSAATNLSTLSVMPSVYRLDTGVFTPNNGQIGTYWGWDSVATATGYMYSLEFDDDTLFRTVVDKNQGLRLRLVRPAECNEDPGDAIPNAYKDNSGNLYNGIVIGNLVWLTADLKDLEYNNGSVIPVETVNATWAGLVTGALCYPLNDTTYEIEYVIGCKQVKITFENFVENLPAMPGKVVIIEEGFGINVVKTDTKGGTKYTISSSCCVSIIAGDNIELQTIPLETGGTNVIVNAVIPCPMFVEIVSVAGRAIEAVVTGGTAPYTYTWSMADHSAAGASMFQLIVDPVDPTNDARRVPINNPAITDVFDACASANSGRAGLAKVIVTDAAGCKVSDTILHTVVSCS
jgi:uncharacterized protein (TIGR02145 family)